MAPNILNKMFKDIRPCQQDLPQSLHRFKPQHRNYANSSASLAAFALQLSQDNCIRIHPAGSAFKSALQNINLSVV